MYILVRLLIVLGVGVLAAGAIKKSSALRKKLWYGLSAGVLALAFLVMAFIPFENYFFSFDSPEAAFAYYTKSSGVDLVVKGDFCDFVVSRNGTTDTYLIVPKTIDGWKVGIGSDLKERASLWKNGVMVSLFQYKNTDDDFLVISSTNGGEMEISASTPLTFDTLVNKNSYTQKNYVTYFAHIDSFSSPYEVIVDGDRILLEIP